MSNRIELTNDLQREFATRAQKESKEHSILLPHYILPWTRGLLRNDSSLDTIYKKLGTNNFTKSVYVSEVNNLPKEKKLLYRKTLRWLIYSVMNGDYSQVGNSCGAWSTVHWLMRDRKRYFSGLEFTTLSLNLYNNIQFATDDWKRNSRVPAILTRMINLQYVNPWKILQYVNVPKLQITQDAKIFLTNNRSNQADRLRLLLKFIALIKPNGYSIATGNLNNLRPNEKSIIVAYTANFGLHYMLLVKAKNNDWHIFNSNSGKLNPTVLTACPQFSSANANPIVTNLLNTDGTAGGTQTHYFTGVFIKL